MTRDNRIANAQAEITSATDALRVARAALGLGAVRGQTMLYWQKVPMFTVGQPPVTTIAVQTALFEMIRPRIVHLTGA